MLDALIETMNEPDKQLAEDVLKKLCEGAQIDGIRFGPVLQIIISHHGVEKQFARGQVYLNLLARWALFDTRPRRFPGGEEELPEVTPEEEIQRIVAMRERVITKVELGESDPHLILTLDDERVVFVNGMDDSYETWDMGVAFSSEEEPWQVVACPGGRVAVWAPSTFGKDGV